LAATVLVDLAMLAVGPDIGGPPGLSFDLSFGLYFSQISMAAIWLALGQTAALWRMPAAFLLLLGLIAVLCSTLKLNDGDRDVTILIACATSIPLLVLRSVGLGVVRVRRDGPDGVLPPEPQRFQFSIRYLFGLMTCLAVVLGTLQWLDFHNLIDCHRFDLWMYMLAGGHALAVALALWTALGSQWMVARMIVLLTAVAAACVGVFVRAMRHEHLLMLFSLEALLLFGSLWVFRVAGYRVGIWRTQNEEAAAGNGAATVKETSSQELPRV